ncbi:MAG: CopD family protein [Gammaproteobacteria bacterium]
MNLAATYIWIKALHVASVIAFIAGVFAQGLFVTMARIGVPMELAQRFRRAERRLTTPSLLVALASGVTLAALGNWFPAPWLVVKLMLVTLLLALHGLQSGHLRRLAAGQTISSRPLQHAVLATAAIIAMLAVLKPRLL